MRKVYFVLSVDTEEEWDCDGPFPNKVISVENIGYLPAFQSHPNELSLTTSYFLNYTVMRIFQARDPRSQGSIEVTAITATQCRLSAGEALRYCV